VRAANTDADTDGGSHVPCALCLVLQEAASLYEKAGMLEKAAGIYIAAKNFTAAAPLMAQVSSPQLQRQYARAKEAEGR
jgi:WD repeat-containing protein 19